MENKKHHLPKEFAEKMILGLRSGKYKQGYDKYYDPKTNCHCSMGVGYAENGIELNEYGNGIKDADKRVFMSTGENAIWWEFMHLNDHLKKSFPEIADWIEKNVQLK